MRIFLSVPESCVQEILNDASALLSPSTLQCRYLPRLSPHAPVARSPTPVPPVSQPQRRALGELSLPARSQTLLVQRLSADLQRPHRYPAAPEQTVAAALDSGDVSVMSLVLISSHRQGVGCTYPHELSLVLVVTQRRDVLRDGSSVRRYG